MKTIIRMSEAEEAKALPLLLRHSPGTVLPNRIYVVSEEVVKQLREAGVKFTELSRESNAPSLEGVGSGERNMISLFRCTTTTADRLNRSRFKPCSSSFSISLAASPSFPNPMKAFGRWQASPIVMPSLSTAC